MAIAFSQSLITILNTNSGTTATGKFTAAVTAGKFVVVIVKVSSGYVVNSISDPRGNTWVNPAYNSSSGPDVEIWYSYITTSIVLNDLLTVTASGGTTPIVNIIAASFTGVGTFNTVYEDLNTGVLSGTSATATTKTISLGTTRAPDLIIAATGTAGAGSQTFSSSTGTVLAATDTIKQTAMVYQVQGTKAAASPVVTWSGTTTFVYAAVAFFPAGTVLTQTQTGISRIANNKTTTQSSVSRISKSFTATESTLSRISKNLTNTTASLSRISTVSTNTTTAISRILKNSTATQSSVARIQKTSTVTQPNVARIQKTFTTTTATQSRIAKNFSATQPTISKIASNVSSTTSTISRIAKSFTQTTGTVSRVKQIGVNRKNWTTNPNLETSIAGWGVSGAATSKTIAQSSTDKYSGTYSVYATGLLSSTATYGGVDIPISTIPLVIGQKYTISVWVNVTSYGGPNSISIKFYWGAASSGSVSYSASGWQRISVTGTAPVGATAISSQIFVTGGSGTQSTYSFYADNVLLEINDGVGTYFDGSTTGGAWDGTANLSTSTISGAVTLSKSQIQKSLTNTTSTISRIAKSFTSTQPSTARVQKTFTALQTSLGRINVLKTITQTSKATIQKIVTVTQTEIARISKSFTISQNSIARIIKTSNATQTSISRIQIINTVTQSSKANVQIVPNVSASGQSSLTTAGSTLTVTYPTYSAGQTVVINISTNGTMTTPTGWTLIGSKTGSVNLYAIYKIMTGSEGSTLSITLTASSLARTTQYTINAGPTPYKVLTAGATTNAYLPLFSVIPPTITFSGSNNYLIFNALGINITTISVSSYPSNMQGNQLSAASGTSTPGVASSSATVFGVSSFIPTSYTLSSISASGPEMTYGLYFAYEANNQTSKARIQKIFTNLQTSISRIFKTSTNIQTSKTRISNILNVTQGLIANIAPIKGTVINVPITQQASINVPVTQQNLINLSVTDQKNISIPVTQQSSITLPTTIQSSVTTSITQTPILTIPVIASTPITISIIVSFP